MSLLDELRGLLPTEYLNASTIRKTAGLVSSVPDLIDSSRLRYKILVDGTDLKVIWKSGSKKVILSVYIMEDVPASPEGFYDFSCIYYEWVINARADCSTEDATANNLERLLEWCIGNV